MPDEQTVDPDKPIVVESVMTADNPRVEATPNSDKPVVATTLLDAPQLLLGDVPEQFDPEDLDDDETESGESPASNPVAPVCTCGKTDSGRTGPHKKTCPVRGSGFRGDGRRLAGSTLPPTLPTASQVNLPGSEPVASTVDHAAIAGVVFDMSTNGLAVALGAEWKSESAEEKAMVVGPLANYFRAKDVKDVPPGVLLCFVIAAYSAKRVAHPNTKGKLIAAYVTIKPKVQSLVGKFFSLFRRKNRQLELIK